MPTPSASGHTLVLNVDLATQPISRHIYGHFAEHLGRCIYEGLWVGEESKIPNTRGFRTDVVAALKKLNMPNLRWPGGCFADTYRWTDGIGPRANRPSMVNVHWGGTVENNHCGTHEFLDLCDQLSTNDNVVEPYICGNVGSGSVREMTEWLEYLTMPAQSPMSDLRKKNGRKEPWPIKYWAVGNENWGCGGNMRPQYYADLYRQYASYCRHFTPEKKLYKIACGLTEDWNQIILQECHRHMDGLSIHYYTVPNEWAKKGSSTNFDEAEWVRTLKKAADIEPFIVKTAGQMDRFDPEKRIGIIMDEWGTWFDVEPGTNPGFLYQQNTMRDALVTSLSFDVFNRHADRVHMANIAQTVNVLQAMILTEGPKMTLTPTYHVFEMYKAHQGAMLVPQNLRTTSYSLDDGKTKVAQISASASISAAGKLLITGSNLHHADAAELSVTLRGFAAKTAVGRVLTAAKINSMNTFEKPDAVTPTGYDDFTLNGDALTLKLPARSVVSLEVTT